jgi:hypothetical protein
MREQNERISHATGEFAKKNFLKTYFLEGE